MKKYFFFITLLFAINSFSQFSKTHYIPPLAGANSIAVSAQEQYMYISTPSIVPVNFKIKQLGGATITGVVSQSSPYVYNIGYGITTQFHIQESEVNSVLNNKGFIIEADDVVYVTVRVIAGNGNQAGELVSKGLAALGTEFRIGGFLNTLVASYGNVHQTFVSVLATENNTTVKFSNIKPNTVLMNNATVGNNPADVVLNAGQSFVMAVQGPFNNVPDALIGSLISSDKPIVVNCGSFAGTNGNTSNLDLGFDQIVSAERTGKEYIFIKSTGQDVVERILLIAHENNTEIFLNGNAVATYTLNAGDYVALKGSDYNTNGNLYVQSSKNIFAYQSVGDGSRGDQANQELFFVPPLSCQTPKEIDNIPLIEQIGTRNFTGRVTMFTETGSPLTFKINNIDYTLSTLPTGITVVGPTPIVGNPNFETYIITGLTGNVSVFSTKQLYLAAYGSNGAATFGGFYSGFTFKPEITFSPIVTTQANCIPNVDLKVSGKSGYDVFQWYKNGAPITGETNSSFAPTQSGYYNVTATLTACGLTLTSDKIPVSDCATNLDNDKANDNIDIDNDNDGITNCTESYGNQAVNIQNNVAGTIAGGNYSNTFTGSVTTSTTASATPFVGNTDGSFVTSVPAGKTNWVTYTMNFAQPINIGLECVNTANTADLLNADAEYIINSSINKTLTVLNPSNQLLIDTNYDGIYESGITQFSSFEIRFRLNSTTPLAAGAGDFKFQSYQTNSISFTHKNLLDFKSNNATLKFYAICVPKDTDSDGVADQLDLDSDNDGIPDTNEAQGTNFVAFSNIDVNLDGLDDAYETGIISVDSDIDGVLDYLDLDSDNDGIYDLVESGSAAVDANIDGVIDSNAFGINGLANSLETALDNGILNYTIADTDADKSDNYIEIDSDNDLCNDVIEAGFTDANNDGLLGNTPLTINANGVVTSGIGYTTPNINYITAAPIVINTQPVDKAICELQSATFTITTNVVNSYQWQVSIDNGLTFNNLVDNATYSGTNTTLLTVATTNALNNNKYRVSLNKNGNSCGLISTSATLTVFPLPVITSPLTLVQCDDDTDGISTFNLRQKENAISAKFATETFTYYNTFAGVNAATVADLIANPTTYISGNKTIWVRVENANGCFRVAQLDLVVSVTQIPATFHRNLYVCDDYIDATNNDRDGISTFDFSSVTADILALLPTTAVFTIKYYQNSSDALLENDANGNSLAITNTTNYRNIGSPNVKQIWVRIESNLDNACFGLGSYVTLTVEALPVANAINTTNILRHCDDNQDGNFGFDTSTIQATVLGTQTNKTVTYYDQNNNVLPSPLPNPFVVNTNQIITVRVTNNVTNVTTGACFAEEKIQFIVDDLPETFAIPTSLLTNCDDEVDPMQQNGLFAFDTSTFQATILGTQTGMTVKYIDSNGKTLPSPLPNPFVSGTQNIIVTVENPINTTCIATQILPFVVNPVPKIALTGKAVVCLNLPADFVQLDPGIQDNSPTSNYTYIWEKDGIFLTDTTPTISINTAGVYTVKVTNSFGCSRLRTITVNPSDIAIIKNIDIVDLTDENTVTVTVDGVGNYVYNLDDEFGYYQNSNIFTNVAMGIHTVFVKDENGCGVVSQEINVLGTPKFFTPNNDGYNDYWNIKGVSPTFNANSIIYIFDRYGKLLKQFSPLNDSNGWDGTFNGEPLPSDDYWFSIKLENGREAKGHFSLKR